MNLGFSDVQILPKLSSIESRKDVSLMVSYRTPISKWLIRCVPIIASNMDSIGTLEMAKSLGKLDCLTALHKYYPVKEFQGPLKWLGNNDSSGFFLHQKSFITVGIKNEDFEFLEKIEHINSSMICIDVANGYITKFHEFIKKVRNRWPNVVLMAGNVCTPEGIREVYRAGADIIKIGIGTSQFCRTSQVTGIGKKSFSTIKECREYLDKQWDAYPKEKPLLCLDGGCREAGDVCKAFGAGANFVMLGSLLAGTQECNGDWEYDHYNNEKAFLTVYGMSSKEAMDKYNNYKDYRASEGIAMKVAYKGPAADIVSEILGGLRSACSYTNHRKLETFINNVQFTY